jgi:23S rRNA (guanosine2251-2'-O)-methyltransferase
LKQKEIKDLANSLNISIIESSSDKLSLFTGNRETHGVVLKTEVKSYYYVKKPEKFFGSLNKTDSNLLILLDQVVDPQNFGSIIRSSTYLGADCVMVNKYNKCNITSALAKVSSGASELIPLITVKFIKLFLEEAIKNNYKVLTTFISKDKMSNSKPLDLNQLTNKLKKGDNCVLLLGSEGAGISEVLMKSSTINLYIPSKIIGNNPVDREINDSLNVGVTAGIIIDKVCKLIK